MPEFGPWRVVQITERRFLPSYRLSRPRTPGLLLPYRIPGRGPELRACPSCQPTREQVGHVKTSLFLKTWTQHLNRISSDLTLGHLLIAAGETSWVGLD